MHLPDSLSVKDFLVAMQQHNLCSYSGARTAGSGHLSQSRDLDQQAGDEHLIAHSINMNAARDDRFRGTNGSSTTQAMTYWRKYQGLVGAGRGVCTWVQSQ
jgi:hypothetical protein